MTPGLPKTRSGKIMRRILKKIVAHEYDQMGDISTLADPSVVEHLVAEYKRLCIGSSRGPQPEIMACPTKIAVNG